MRSFPCSTRLAVFGLAISTFAIAGAAAQWQVTVRAGAYARNDTLASFPAPEGLSGAATLSSAEGGRIAVQVDEAGRRCHFIVAQLAKGEARTYTLSSATAAATAVSVTRAGDQLRLNHDGQPLFTYQMAPGPVPAGVPEIFRHGAHLHPVYTPSGRIVTGDHPADHRWHRGVWLAWTSTEFEGRHLDFWNQGKGSGQDKSGTKLEAEVRFAGLERFWDGPVCGGFVGRHTFVDHTGGTPREVLNETWEVLAFRAGGSATAINVIDLVSTQTCAGSAPLKLPKYYYGGLGVRGHPQWDPVDAVTMLTSNGDDRIKGNSTKGRWVHLGGEVDGRTAGLAVLIHPSNFRFPQPLRLNPKNPQICIAPSQEGDWEITPGRPYVSRYRLIIADGPADAARLEALWADYANPVTVEVATR